MSELEKKQVSLGYSAREDRLVLWLGHDERAAVLHLTRRLAAMLIDGLAGILARSSTMAAQAPADLRDDIVLMEHQGAMVGLAAHRANESDLPPVSAELEPPLLIETVNITVDAQNFLLVFRPPEAAGGEAELPLSRADLHRVLDMLRRQAELAEWNLPLDRGWLAGSSGQVTVN